MYSLTQSESLSIDAVSPQTNMNLCPTTVPQLNTTFVHNTSDMPRNRNHTTEYGQPPRPSAPTSSYAELPYAVQPSFNPAQNVQLVSSLDFCCERNSCYQDYRFSGKQKCYFVWKSSFENVFMDLQVKF